MSEFPTQQEVIDQHLERLPIAPPLRIPELYLIQNMANNMIALMRDRQELRQEVLALKIEKAERKKP